MLPQKLVLTLCCIFGAALPISVIAQTPGGLEPGGGGISVPGGSTSSPATEPTGLTSPSPTSTPTGGATSDPMMSSPSPTSTPTGGATSDPMMSPAPTDSPTEDPTASPTTSPMLSPEPEASPTTEPTKKTTPKSTSPQSQSQPVNINTATSQELIKVKGIGAPTASKIVSGRPYSNLDELVSKKIVTPQQLKAMKSQLSY
jgi:DNA uptake protein ComE-like DNA-binding protein